MRDLYTPFCNLVLILSDCLLMLVVTDGVFFWSLVMAVFLGCFSSGFVNFNMAMGSLVL
jgi:hypothetical protein